MASESWHCLLLNPGNPVLGAGRAFHDLSAAPNHLHCQPENSSRPVTISNPAAGPVRYAIEPD
jgi:hypothetical protein